MSILVLLFIFLPYPKMHIKMWMETDTVISYLY